MKFVKLLFLGVFCIKITFAQSLPPYKNPALPVPERVKDLLGRMTAEEKFWQLFMIPGDLDNAGKDQYKNGIFGFQVSAGAKGDAGGQLLTYNTSENAAVLLRKINSIQKYFVEETRLGIPVIAFDEALHGLVRDGATAFPQSIALAASFDTALMRQVATAIATETMARGIRDILSPVINIASDVRWGRTEETYGEDPFLTSEMGVAFMKSFEQMGIITTPKHFIANVGDGGRDSYPIHWNERLLDEIYLPPFKAAIERAGARSIMTAYNSLDGTASSANKWLLRQKLKQEWGFKGFVISDANAVGGEVVLHNTAKTYADAGAHAVNNGLDVIFQTDYNHYKLFIDPFLDGTVNQQRIDEAVARVLTAKFELGLFEHPYADSLLLQKIRDMRSHKAIAREAAIKSMVLLKNNNQILPLQANLKRIAVIGTEAQKGRLGGYSGKGNGTVNFLDGIRARAGKIQVDYASGVGLPEEAWETIPEKALQHDGQPGLTGAYFTNLNLTGEPEFRRSDREINYSWTLFSPDPRLEADNYSIRWTGELIAPQSGNFQIGLEGNDGFRLYLNGKLLIDRWNKQSYSRQLVNYTFEANRKYAIRVEFYESQSNARIRLIWTAGVKNDWKEKINQAVAAARKADLAIVTAGIHEGEFQDRAMLNLQGHQEEMIRAVAATGKPVVVVLTGGSAITMGNWINEVGAILYSWYSGEEGGNALAAILFGDANPAGRLPITFPVHEAQLPLVYNHKPTGRGDDYYNLSGQPLFPFGYGLSYTSFEYSNLRLDQPVIKKGSGTRVSFELRNTGAKSGDEVVQLYIRDILATVARPVLELKGFQRVSLAPGERRTISFEIGPDMLEMLDVNLKKNIEPGDFRIMIGASSRDLRVKTTLTVTD